MGSNKALLRFADGSSVIERIAGRLRPLCEELLIVTNTPADYAFLGLAMFEDAYPGASSLGGIYTGLLYAANDRALTVSCDLPLIRTDVLAYLLSLPFDYDLLMPFLGGRQQPLHAIYAKTCLTAIQAQIVAGDLKIVRLLENLRGRTVDETELDAIDPRHLSFRNMNTPEDWAEVQEIAAQLESAG